MENQQIDPLPAGRQYDLSHTEGILNELVEGLANETVSASQTSFSVEEAEKSHQIIKNGASIYGVKSESGVGNKTQSQMVIAEVMERIKTDVKFEEQNNTPQSALEEAQGLEWSEGEVEDFLDMDEVIHGDELVHEDVEEAEISDGTSLQADPPTKDHTVHKKDAHLKGSIRSNVGDNQPASLSRGAVLGSAWTLAGSGGRGHNEQGTHIPQHSPINFGRGRGTVIRGGHMRRGFMMPPPQGGRAGYAAPSGRQTWKSRAIAPFQEIKQEGRGNEKSKRRLEQMVGSPNKMRPAGDLAVYKKEDQLAASLEKLKMSSKGPDEKGNGFDVKEQDKILQEVFLSYHLACDPTMRNKIISKGVTMKRIIGRDEIGWYCEGIRDERAVSASMKMESMIAQLSGDLGHMTAFAKTLADLTEKQKETTSSLVQLQMGWISSGATSVQSSGSPSPSKPQRATSERSVTSEPPQDAFDFNPIPYKAAMQKLKFQEGLISDNSIVSLFRRVVTDEELHVINNFAFSERELAETNRELYVRMEKAFEKICDDADVGKA